ncbi:E3 ubiquitin-protein ligase RFWD3-like isoform X1 [Diorhabda sublineata]|uniref:E3 ubiquitin-protein ligase RFWD3-like isoform X1 n=2 Tax=Diorhabda sublineata TaxID=1163346 RepID=UPI0024E0DC3D|nr:E3 ubiquitin-protein ligase RFWD3-like isoform X1 [Diorhabda sublineata]
MDDINVYLPQNNASVPSHPFENTSLEMEVNSQEQITISQTPNGNLETTNDIDNEDGTLCPICLDNWTNSGDHRICALKCGHLFCYKCVYRWLDTQQEKSCPTCKKKACKSEIRFIYTKKLIAVDNTELENVKQQLNVAIEEKNRLQMDLSKYICREEILKQEIAQLKSHINELTKKRINNSRIPNNEINPTIKSSIRLYMEKSLEICRQNGCRVFDYSNAFDSIVSSSKSPNNLFSGFGIRKVNMSLYKPLAFVPLHNQQIRDLRFHSTNNWLLTASMDKCFKVTDTNANKVICTTKETMPLWSCCWDSDNQYNFYTGTQSGNLIKHDIRNLNEPLCTLSIEGDASPVVSIASIPRSPGSDFHNGAVVSCKLNSLWIFENDGESYQKHSLPLNGPFVSMKYEKELKQLLVSSRPNHIVPHSTHSLCTLNKNPDGEINCLTTHTFQGGGMQKLLSKTCFVSDEQQYIAAFEESYKRVFLWSIHTGDKVCSVPANEAVLDLNGVKNSNGNFLVSLTERKMDFFKFQ